MCWCTPTKRTPCCGSPKCHGAAIVAGVLPIGDSCPYCHPAPAPCTHKVVGPCDSCALERALAECDDAKERADELAAKLEAASVELAQLRASARLAPMAALERLRGNALSLAARVQDDFTTAQVVVDLDTLKDELARTAHVVERAQASSG